MRVTTDLFISAMLRRVFGAGGFGAVLKHGSAEAGAAFIVMRGRSGVSMLYGPSPQTDYDEGKPDDRRFSMLMEGQDEDVSARMAKEERFDPDLWLVEIEGGSVSAEDLLNLVKR